MKQMSMLMSTISKCNHFIFLILVILDLLVDIRNNYSHLISQFLLYLDFKDFFVPLNFLPRIRINMQPRRGLSPRSSGAASVSSVQRQTPVASPLSSYHHTPILRSPLSPYIQAPGPTPTLSSSPAKSFPGSPHELAGPAGNSPASHRVSKACMLDVLLPLIIIARVKCFCLLLL